MLHDVSGPGVIKVFSEWEKKRGIKLIKSGILTGYGSRRIILSLPLIEFLQRILQHFPTLLDSMASINISHGLGQYGICHTLSHEEALVLPGEVLLEGTRITTPLEPWVHGCGLGTHRYCIYL